MYDPQRDPFFEGLWADVQEGIDAANRGELLDGEDVFRELLREGIEAADRGDLFDLEDVARELRGAENEPE